MSECSLSQNWPTGYIPKSIGSSNTPSRGAAVEKQAESTLPPMTNRGVGKSHNFYGGVFTVDWLRLTVWTDKKGVQELLEIYGVDVGLELTGHGAQGFRVVYSGQNGFQLYCEPANENQVFVSLAFPSKCLQHIGLEAVMEGHDWLCEKGLAGLRWGCTRIDLAFDTQGFEVSEFVEAFFNGHVETKAKSHREIKDSDGGHTFYVGSRESAAMLRVYHKMDGHSFGDEAFTRVELELKEDRAMLAVFEILQAGFNEMPGLAANILAGFLTVNASWWVDFMGEVKKSWVRLRRNIPTVESIKNYLYKQVAPSLVTYLGAVSGGDLAIIRGEFNKLILQGKKKLRKSHYELMAAYQEDTQPVFSGGF